MNASTSNRTWFTTLLAFAALLLGGLGSLFSLLAFLLAMGQSRPNTFELLGFFVIFILPPSVLLAGFGLLLRKRWARWWMLLLMSGLVLIGLKGLIAPSHKDPAYAPVPGPAADALNRQVVLESSAAVTVGALVLLGLCTLGVRREFSA